MHKIYFLNILQATILCFLTEINVTESLAAEQLSLNQAARIEKIVEEEHRTFENEVMDYKLLILRDPSPVTHSDKKAYFFLLKSLRFKSLLNMSPGIQKVILDKHKTSMLARKIAYDRLVHPDKGNKQYVPGINNESLATISDFGWESANILSNKLELASKPKNTNLNEPSQTNKAIPMAAVLNVGASGLSLGLSFFEALYYFEKHGSTEKIKKDYKRAKSELEALSQSLDFENLNASEYSQMMGKEAAEQAIKLRELQDKLEIDQKNLEKVFKSFSINGFLSSTYFSSSAMVLWGAASISMGIASNVLGGISYGSILSLMSAKGFAKDLSSLKQIDINIKETENLYDEISKDKYSELEFIEALRLKNYLKLKHLKNSGKKNKIWNSAKNAFTFGLGASVTGAGALGVAAAVGTNIAVSSALAFSGYGISVFLGGALVCGCVAMASKHDSKVRPEDLHCLKLDNEKSSKIKKNYKKYMRKKLKSYQRYTEELESHSELFNSYVSQGAPKELLDRLFTKMIELSKKIDKHEDKIRKKQMVLTQLQMLLQAKSSKARKAAYRLFSIIDQLDEDKTNRFAKYFGIDMDENWQKLEKQKDHIKFSLAQSILAG